MGVVYMPEEDRKLLDIINSGHVNTVTNKILWGEFPDDKYYIPDIEEVFVGYKAEWLDTRGDWKEFTFYGGDIASFYDDKIRTPYLTREQIESEGWEFKGKSVDLWFEKPGTMLRDDGHHFSSITLQYGVHDHRLVIKPKFTSGDEECFFEGECKSINEFRTICKLLKIN